MTGYLLRELDLDSIEQVPINDGRLLAGQYLTLELYLTYVEAVAQQVSERTAGEMNASDGLAGL